MPHRPWIIVSNRLPVTVDPVTGDVVAASGGLVTALKGVRVDEVAMWAGSVPHAIDAAQWPEVAARARAAGSAWTFLPVFIPRDEYEPYYNGVCNDALWPLLHYETGFVSFDPEQWRAYEAVNRRFARVLAAAAPDGALVWIHDFHLFLLPGMLREERPDLRIGFFLHVPFPSSEIFRQLPVREQVLHSLLHCDLIGFHDYDYLRHFCNAVRVILGIDSNLLSIELPGGTRTTHLGVYPVSIDTPTVAKRAASAGVLHRMASHRKRGSWKHLVLGVDRLDYTKGLELKLRAFERALERFEHLREGTVLVQVAVPSRTDVPRYRELRAEVERLVGRINGRFGRPGYAPVHYLFTSVPFEDLLALYRAADVLLVTSKRDGMNLVALEYVASQRPANPGVLCLSEFAGSASYLSEAVLINPWNVDDTAGALASSLSMPLDERRRRHRAMMHQLRAYTASDWARSFMEGLAHTERLPGAPGLPRVADAREIRALVDAKPVWLLIDYDGTLVPIRPTPAEAALDEETRQRLERLVERGKLVETVVVSGRDTGFMARQLGALPVSLAAEHGARFRRRGLRRWRTLVRTDRESWYGTALAIMEGFQRRTPGSAIERKRYAVAWHYRKAPARFGEHQARRLVIELDAALANSPATTVLGNKVVEARAVEANKGAFFRWLWYDSGLVPHGAVVVAIGDDTTDEDLFAALPSGSVGIRVGRVPSRAHFRLDRQSDVLPFLEAVFLGDDAA